MEEHKIGTRITLPDGRKAEVVEGLCENCFFFCINQWWCVEHRCMDEERTDHKAIIYKEIKEYV